MVSKKEAFWPTWLVRATALAAGLNCLAAWAAPLAAGQVNEIGIGAGIGVPVYEAAAVHGPGIHVLGYAGYRMGQALQLRGEVSFTELSADRAAWGRLRIGRVGATLAYSPFGTGNGVYALAGAGMYALRNPQRGGDPGLVPGITLGVGASGQLAGMTLFAEAREEVPFSTYGTDTESAPTMYIPLAVGIRVPCCGRTPPR